MELWRWEQLQWESRQQEMQQRAPPPQQPGWGGGAPLPQWPGSPPFQQQWGAGAAYPPQPQATLSQWAPPQLAPPQLAVSHPTPPQLSPPQPVPPQLAQPPPPWQMPQPVGYSQPQPQAEKSQQQQPHQRQPHQQPQHVWSPPPRAPMPTLPPGVELGRGSSAGTAAFGRTAGPAPKVRRLDLSGSRSWGKQYEPPHIPALLPTAPPPAPQPVAHHKAPWRRQKGRQNRWPQQRQQHAQREDKSVDVPPRRRKASRWDQSAAEPPQPQQQQPQQQQPQQQPQPVRASRWDQAQPPKAAAASSAVPPTPAVAPVAPAAVASPAVLLHAPAAPGLQQADAAKESAALGAAADSDSEVPPPPPPPPLPPAQQLSEQPPPPPPADEVGQPAHGSPPPMPLPGQPPEAGQQPPELPRVPTAPVIQPAAPERGVPAPQPPPPMPPMLPMHQAQEGPRLQPPSQPAAELPIAAAEEGGTAAAAAAKAVAVPEGATAAAGTSQLLPSAEEQHSPGSSCEATAFSLSDPAYVAAALAVLPAGPQRSCALRLLSHLDSEAPGRRLSPGAVASWAREQGFAAADLREALVALQDAAVLFFDPGLPAGANAGRPAAMHWDLQHIAAGLGLDEAAVEAAAAQAAAFGGQWEAGSGGESPTGSDCVANGTCGEGAAGCKARSSSSSPDSMVDEAAQFDDPDTATSKALPLPPALAAKWLQSALPPSSTSLQLLRPAAATVLRAMLAAPGGQLTEAELHEAAAAYAAAAGQRGSAKDLPMCCRELLEHLQLIERPPAIRTRSRPWRLLPHQAGVAAAAVAALLRAEKPAAQWTPATAGMEGEGSEAKEEGDEEDGQSRGGGSTSLAQQPQQAAGLDTAGAAGAAAQPAAWPIQFSPSIEAELQKRHMGTQRYRRRIQRYAASVLHTLLQVPPGTAMPTKQLERAAAAAAGEAGVATKNTFSMARKMLTGLGLVASQKPSGSSHASSRCWAVPPAALKRARAVVADAIAAEALRGRSSEEAGAAAGPEQAAAADTTANPAGAAAAAAAAAAGEQPAATGEQASGRPAPAQQEEQEEGQQLLQQQQHSFALPLLLCAGPTVGRPPAGQHATGGSSAPASQAQPGGPPAEQPASGPASAAPQGGQQSSWPMPFSDEFMSATLADRSRTPSKQYVQRVRRWAVSCLQCLLQCAPGSSLSTSELLPAAAAALNEQGQGGTGTVLQRARKVLLAVDLLQCSVQLGTERWGLPQHARPRAAAIVASAVAAGVLSPAVEAAAPAPASTVTNKRGQQPSAVGAADEPAPSSSKRHKQEQQEGSPAPAATGDSLAPTVPLEGAAERSSASLPSVAPRSSPSSTVAGPSAATATAAAAAARTQSIAIGGAAALADAAPSRPAQPPQANAAAAPVATAAIAPSAPVGGTAANGGSGGGGGSGPAQLLPAPDELGELLTLPEGDVQLLPLAVQLLEVAEWAGVDLVQAAQFADQFTAFSPSKRGLYYRQMWSAAEQQDASKVRRLVAHALQPRPAGTAASSMWSGAGGER